MPVATNIVITCKYEDRIGNISIALEITYKGVRYHSNALAIEFIDNKHRYVQLVNPDKVVDAENIMELIRAVDKYVSKWYCYEYDKDNDKHISSYKLKSIEPLIALVNIIK